MGADAAADEGGDHDRRRVAPVDRREEGEDDGGEEVRGAGEGDLDRVEVLEGVGDEEGEQGEDEDADRRAEVGLVGAAEGDPGAVVLRSRG